MADKLLIRMFDVGLGDFVYVRIPDAHTADRDFHMVIDCGTLSGIDYLKAAVPTLLDLLPQIEGKPCLDLLIVTHKHKDHMAGFGPPLWENVSIKAIWMSAAMDPQNPEAQRARKLHTVAGEALRQFAASGQRGAIETMFAAYEFDNDAAVQNLTVNLPAANDIPARYVSAGMSTATDPSLAAGLKDAVFNILGPEEKIDYWYLGKPEKSAVSRLVDAGDAVMPVAIPGDAPDVKLPSNISSIDFRNLQARMLSSALAFSDGDGQLVNNTSVVLLISWKGRRLLFVGDAEWEGRFAEGSGNGAWNTMWNRQKDLLNAPVDFLKVGHHGSVNATPWDNRADRSKAYEPADILNAILPQARSGDAKAVVSTERGRYETIPKAELLAEIGKRVSTVQNYEDVFKAKGLDQESINKFDDFEKYSFGKAQPWRTDFEFLTSGAKYIDVELDPT